jgi:hypothetical protein
MSSWIHKKSIARAIATTCAMLVLFAQLVGAVHFHQDVVSHHGIVDAALSVDQGQCPVCQLAFHSPGSVVAAPTVSRGPAFTDTIVRARTTEIESPVLSAERDRAPPVLS